jgi:hypothetical protein
MNNVMADKRPRFLFLVESNSVLKIENQTIGVESERFFDLFFVASWDIEENTPWFSCTESA